MRVCPYETRLCGLTRAEPAQAAFVSTDPHFRGFSDPEYGVEKVIARCAEKEKRVNSSSPLSRAMTFQLGARVIRGVTAAKHQRICHED